VAGRRGDPRRRRTARGAAGQLPGPARLGGASSPGAAASAEPERHRHDNRCRYLTGSRATPATGALPQARAGSFGRQLRVLGSQSGVGFRERVFSEALDHPRGSPPIDSQAPPLTRGNASYCGFQAYLGCTPTNAPSGSAAFLTNMGRGTGGSSARQGRTCRSTVTCSCPRRFRDPRGPAIIERQPDGLDDATGRAAS
jgi:hypothetical protein